VYCVAGVLHLTLVDSRAVVTKRTGLQVRLWNWEAPFLTLTQYGWFNLIFSAAENSTQGDGSEGDAVAPVEVAARFPAEHSLRHCFISNSYIFLLITIN
jgi:hypothetical protein